MALALARTEGARRLAMARSHHFASSVILSATLFASGCSGSDAPMIGRGSPSGSSQVGGAGDGNGVVTAEGNRPAGGDETPAGSTAASLFATPSNAAATADSLYGLWGGAYERLDWKYDRRMKFEVGQVTIAERCTDWRGRTGGIAAVTSKARIADDVVEILESKDDLTTVGNVTCQVNVRPVRTPRCTETDGFQTNCFVLGGTQLTIYGDTSLDKLELTKISD